MDGHRRTAATTAGVAVATLATGDPVTMPGSAISSTARLPAPASARHWSRKLGALPILGAVASILSACAVRRAPTESVELPPCLRGDGAHGHPSASVEWVLRDDPDERSALDAWCWGVGPAVVSNGPAESPSQPIDSLAVVVWNAHVGNGQLLALVADLRAGRLGGAPVRDFVVLLQEVHRGGPAVPSNLPEWAAAARRTGDPADPARADILAVAREAGLHVVYAPSMRNGGISDARPAEDRGNAILSTLPLTAPTLIELPYERQRRVAVLATIGARTSSGNPWSLSLASVHLDNRARFGRLHRSLGAARLHQARSLLDHLSDVGPAVLGGDLNTWDGGARAGAARVLREQFPLPTDPPEGGTADLPWFLPDLHLDHLFFRLPHGWDASYRVMEPSYGSDHRPLLGWVRTPDAPAGVAAGR